MFRVLNGRSRGRVVPDRVLSLAIGLTQSLSEGHLDVPYHESAIGIYCLQRSVLCPWQAVTVYIRASIFCRQLC